MHFVKNIIIFNIFSFFYKYLKNGAKDRNKDKKEENKNGKFYLNLSHFTLFYHTLLLMSVAILVEYFSWIKINFHPLKALFFFNLKFPSFTVI